MKRIMIVRLVICFALMFTLVTALVSTQSQALSGTGYKVWIGMHTAPHEAAVNKSSWVTTASKLDGLNCSTPAYKPNPNDTSGYGNFTPSTTADWQAMFDQIPASSRCLIELPLSAMRDLQTGQLPTGQAFSDKVKEVLTADFQTASKLHYTIHSIMFYSNKLGDTTYSWDSTKITVLRQVLNNLGHSGVSLYWNARNNAADRANCFNANVDGVMMEANDTVWYSNLGNRMQLLHDIWTTTNKPIIFQIPLDKEYPYGNPDTGKTAYQRVRELVRWFGLDQQMGLGFLNSSRVTFEPVTYNWTSVPGTYTFRFFPDIRNNGTAYVNSVTGIALSLIEQRQQFMNGATLSLADHYARP